MAAINTVITRTAADIDAEYHATCAPVLEVLRGLDVKKSSNRQAVSDAGRVLTRARQDAITAHRLLRLERMNRAAAMYANDPVDNAQRLADLTEAGQIAASFTTGIEAKNKLTPRALELLAVGQHERAAVLIRALELRGVIPDKLLSDGLQDLQDHAYANRQEAAELAEKTDRAFTQSWAAITVADAAASQLRGAPEEEAKARLGVKLQEAVLAYQEHRTIKTDAELGLQPYTDNSRTWKRGQNSPDDSRLRGIEPPTPVDAEGHAK